jgi:molybdopterin synthase catalytic subunit
VGPVGNLISGAALESAVKVRLLLFATYREIVGAAEVDVDLPAGATLGDLLERTYAEHPRLKPFEGTTLKAVNMEFAEPGKALEEGDEVALMPPVSGGSGDVRIQVEAIDTAAVLASVRDHAAGANVLFLGSVRSDPGVTWLDYETYDAMAVQQLERLRETAIEKFGLTRMRIVHRRGRIPLGEDAIAIAVSAPHRREAFAAAQWAMDQVKLAVPIWKSGE